MKSLVILMIETDLPEGLSARKLVVETAKHNVLTAYNSREGIELLRRFPNVDAVLIHGSLQDCDEVVAKARELCPTLPIIVACPHGDCDHPGATYSIDSHRPDVLLSLLANKFNASLENA